MSNLTTKLTVVLVSLLLLMSVLMIWAGWVFGIPYFVYYLFEGFDYAVILSAWVIVLYLKVSMKVASMKKELKFIAEELEKGNY